MLNTKLIKPAQAGFINFYQTNNYYHEVNWMDNRTEYIERVSAQMVEWDTQIDQLEYKVDSATYGKHVEYLKVLETLKLKRNETAIKLKWISAAIDAEWENIKSGTEQVWSEVRTILNAAAVKIT